MCAALTGASSSPLLFLRLCHPRSALDRVPDLLTCVVIMRSSKRKRPHGDGDSPEVSPPASPAAAPAVTMPSRSASNVLEAGMITLEQCKNLLEHAQNHRSSTDIQDVWNQIPDSLKHLQTVVTVSFNDVAGENDMLGYKSGTPRLVWWHCDRTCDKEGGDHQKWGVAGDDKYFEGDPKAGKEFSDERKKLRVNVRKHFGKGKVSCDECGGSLFGCHTAGWSWACLLDLCVFVDKAERGRCTHQGER